MAILQDINRPRPDGHVCCHSGYASDPLAQARADFLRRLLARNGRALLFDPLDGDERVPRYGWPASEFERAARTLLASGEAYVEYEAEDYHGPLAYLVPTRSEATG